MRWTAFSVSWGELRKKTKKEKNTGSDGERLQEQRRVYQFGGSIGVLARDDFENYIVFWDDIQIGQLGDFLRGSKMERVSLKREKKSE